MKDTKRINLKPIPQNIVVHTPTEAEAKELLAILHENGYCWTSGKILLENNYWYYRKDDTAYIIFSDKKMVDVIISGVFNSRILTFAKFKEMYCEDKKPQPKFKVGDKVIHNHKNRELGQIVNYFPDEKCCYSVRFGGEYHNMAEHQLSPYTEPEIKSTEDMETKELNLCELLKGHEGKEFYSPYYGVMELMAIRDGLLCFQNSNIGIDLLPSGHSQCSVDGYCAIFPSKALYEQYPLDAFTAWMEWKREQKKPFICIHWGEVDCNGDEEEDYTGNTYFHTPADRDKCLEEIKVIMEKYGKK